MRVMTEETKKRFRDTFVNISTLRVVRSRKSMPNSIVMVVKKGGLSSLLVNS